MLKMGLIGTGAAGNQVIYTALEENISNNDLLAINSSEIDVEQLKESVDTIVLGGQGCGKDINIAQKTIKMYLKDHITKFEKFRDYDMIWLVGSTGGGTNSGMLDTLATVLVKVLKFKVGIMAIFPKHNESLAAQNNTLKCSNNIERLSRELGIPYAIYDNQQVEGSPVKVYKRINKEIIQDFKILRGDLNHYSPFSIIDDMDNKKLVYQPGMFRIGKVSGIKQVYTEKTPLSTLIVEALSNSLNVPSEKDRVVGRIGYYLNLTEQLLEEFDSENTIITEKVGNPKAYYSQLNLIKEDQEGSLAILMTGLSFPKTRVDEIVEILEKSKEDVTKQIKEETFLQEKVDETSEWFNDSSDIDIDDLLGKHEQENNESDKSDISLDDILSNL